MTTVFGQSVECQRSGTPTLPVAWFYEIYSHTICELVSATMTFFLKAEAQSLALFRRGPLPSRAVQTVGSDPSFSAVFDLWALRDSRFFPRNPSRRRLLQISRQKKSAVSRGSSGFLEPRPKWRREGRPASMHASMHALSLRPTKHPPAGQHSRGWNSWTSQRVQTKIFVALVPERRCGQRHQRKFRRHQVLQGDGDEFRRSSPTRRESRRLNPDEALAVARARMSRVEERWGSWESQIPHLKQAAFSTGAANQPRTRKSSSRGQQAPSSGRETR